MGNMLINKECGLYGAVHLSPTPSGQYSLTRADDGQHRHFAVKRVHGLATPDGKMSTLLHQE